jgi:hypothetical protein
MNKENLLRLVRLNPSLKQVFLKKLIHYPIEDRILVDEDLYPNCIMIPQGEVDKLYAYFDRIYFYKKNQVEVIELSDYRAHQKALHNPLMRVGDRVTLILDGNLYRITEISPDNNRYTIVSNQTSMTIKVPKEVLKR